MSAGWSNRKRDPLNDKTVYRTIKPAEHRQLGAIRVHEMEPLSRLYKEAPAAGPYMRTRIVHGTRNSGQEFGRAFGFY